MLNYVWKCFSIPMSNLLKFDTFPWVSPNSIYKMSTDEYRSVGLKCSFSSLIWNVWLTLKGPGVGVGTHPPTVFCPLLKKSSYNTYLKFLDFSQLLVADTPMIFFFNIFYLHPLSALLGHPVQKLFLIFCFN